MWIRRLLLSPGRSPRSATRIRSMWRRAPGLSGRVVSAAQPLVLVDFPPAGATWAGAHGHAYYAAPRRDPNRGGHNYPNVRSQHVLPKRDPDAYSYDDVTADVAPTLTPTPSATFEADPHRLFLPMVSR